MKKLFLLTIAAAISLGSIAQGNSNRAHQNQKAKKEKKSKNRDYDNDRNRNDDWRNRDGDYRRDDANRDGDWRNRRNDDDRNRDTRNGDWRTGRNDDDRYDRRYDQNSGQAPRKVRDAFYRDYPNASNVAWTKDRGIWSARFKRSGLFGGNTSVSYRANGERVSNNNLVFNNRN